MRSIAHFSIRICVEASQIQLSQRRTGGSARGPQQRFGMEEKMAFDYKKEYKEFYLPPKKPGIIDVPAMNYVAVRGRGNPNEPEGEYQAAMGILYGIAFTIKMSERAGHAIEGYFSYVVPPLEGLWRQRKETGEIREAGTFDYGKKDELEWISMIRLPEFVTQEVFDRAVREAEEKKQKDFSKAEFFTYCEGLCVQCMHVGAYDDEPDTIRRMRKYAEELGYAVDDRGAENVQEKEPEREKNGKDGVLFQRFHHEIYLSDPRRTAPERLRTVIRQPVVYICWHRPEVED